jgi:HEXXH motif-containing protein
VRPGAPGWRELRRATAGPLRVLVDDLDPFRMPTRDVELAERLTPSQMTGLRDTLFAAWPMLSPASAAVSRQSSG